MPPRAFAASSPWSESSSCLRAGRPGVPLLLLLGATALLWLGFLPGAAAAVPVAVDPAVTLVTGPDHFATEWEQAGNLEGWAAQDATVSVAGGVLTGTSTGPQTALSLPSLSSGPDLDLGWNDFLEVRLRVPRSYRGSIQLLYGTTPYGIAGKGGTVPAATTGFSTERCLTIPAAQIPPDGRFHTYRLDLGLEPRWRATLHDLRLRPLGETSPAGASFAVEYLRLGDEPGAAVYEPQITPQMPADGASHLYQGGFDPAKNGQSFTVHSVESKHFRFLWDDSVPLDFPQTWTAELPHGTLRNFEEIWQNHTRRLGYVEPATDLDGRDRQTRRKVNITCWTGGYFASDDASGPLRLPYFNATPEGLRVDPPSWVGPHEMMHVYQGFNPTPEPWAETQADYAVARWLELYQFTYEGDSNLSALAIQGAHQLTGNGRAVYLSWPLFMYLDENPDGLPGLGEGTTRRAFAASRPGEWGLQSLARLAPRLGLKNILGCYARHGATLSLRPGPTAAYLAAAVQEDETSARFQITDLEPRPDDPAWWRVPFEMAPQQGAYTIHELAVPRPGAAGRSVTVRFHGLPDRVRGADWRVSLIAVDALGHERYSSLWSQGVNTIRLRPTENRLFLSVAATPHTFFPVDNDETTAPYRSAPVKARFPYELQVFGAAPLRRGAARRTEGMVLHPNGGGYKDPSAQVEATAFLGPQARVYGQAQVLGEARVEGFAVVQDRAVVRDQAVVSDHAWVREDAMVQEHAKVRDWAILAGSATLTGEARALERAVVSGRQTVQDQAVIKGTAISFGGTQSGNAIVDGDYFSDRDNRDAYVTGHLPWVGVPDSFLHPLPSGLYAAYSFGTAHDSRILDDDGVTDGFTTGQPLWVAREGVHTGFLLFNGRTQSVTLDRSVADLRDATFSVWVKPQSQTALQPILWLGTSAQRRLFLTGDDGAGHICFAIANEAGEQLLLAPSALPAGQWSHLAVTLDSTHGLGILYLNGQPVSRGPITLRPEQILSADPSSTPQQNYLARAAGRTLPFFTGALDEVRFYSRALSAEEVAALAAAPGKE